MFLESYLNSKFLIYLLIFIIILKKKNYKGMKRGKYAHSGHSVTDEEREKSAQEHAKITLKGSVVIQ